MGEAAERGVLYVFRNHMAQCIYQFYSINSSWSTSFYFLWSTLQGLLLWHILFYCLYTILHFFELHELGFGLNAKTTSPLVLWVEMSTLKLIDVMLTTSASDHAFSSLARAAALLLQFIWSSVTSHVSPPRNICLLCGLFVWTICKYTYLKCPSLFNWVRKRKSKLVMPATSQSTV